MKNKMFVVCLLGIVMGFSNINAATTPAKEIVKVEDREYRSSVRIYVNNELLNVQSCPVYISKNRRVIRGIAQNAELSDICVPAKWLAESFGGTVTWDKNTKKSYIVYNNSSYELTNPTIRNNTTIITMDEFAKAFNLDISIDHSSNSVDIFTKGTFIQHPLKVPVKSVNEFGNIFKGRYNNQEDTSYLGHIDKVIIASRSDLPINIGNWVIHDVYLNNAISFPNILVNKKSQIHKYTEYKKGSTLTVRTENSKEGDYYGPDIYFAASDGINRYRNQILYVTKYGDTLAGKVDEKDITTALYPVISAGDQELFNSQYRGKDYLNFKITDMKYIVIKGQDVLLAIPTSEILKK